MTTLYQIVSAARIQAMKARDSATSTSLGTLLGEAKQIATKKENRDPTDDEMIGVIKKTLEGIADILKYEKDDIKKAELITERDTLQKYMPTQLSEVEIETIIQNSGLDHPGKIIGLFKKNYFGKYDAGNVKQIAERILAGSATT